MSKFSDYVISVSRDVRGRVGPLYRVTVQIVRQRAWRKRDLAVVTAAVAAIGLTVGLFAALTPSSATAHVAMADDDAARPAATHQAAGQPQCSGAGTPTARKATPVQATPVQATPTQAPVRQQPAPKPVKTKAPTSPAEQPYALYDSVTPGRIPASHNHVATYATGHYAVAPSTVHGRTVMWIDTNGSDPRTASVLDVEPGNVSPAYAATWAKARLTADPGGLARIYTMRSEWAATKAAIATLPAWMQARVHWWIADPTGVPHVLPGAGATQWYWGKDYDISSVNHGF